MFQGFLDDPRLAPGVLASAAALRVRSPASSAGGGGDGDPSSRAQRGGGPTQTNAAVIDIPGGLPMDAAAALVAAHPLGAFRLLTIHHSHLPRFCGASADAQVNAAEEVVLRAAFGVRIEFCGEEDNVLPTDKPWNRTALPLNCTYGFDQPKEMGARAAERPACRREGV